MSINRVNISGNLTRDPELRSTASQMPVLAFGVAVNDRRKNQQTGEWEDYPNFVDCTMFGNRAQSLAQYLQKGSKVFVEGKLRYSSWERDGQKRSKLEVVVDEIDFVSKGQGGQAAQQPLPPAQPAFQPVYQPQRPAYAPQAPQGQLPGMPVPPAAPQPVYQPQAAPQPAYGQGAYDEEIPF
ncbi:single-stranded DNA-binding protein [Adlercreutzia caecimuris]|uniref:single-stranded DNA-binding protein n=1 Tax=Adlercreutzia caecimuris TaxID=671266 RepID=UPI00272B31AB|nr:single-stranded DNA-binding protein [Adlercreutzia caecimuris]